MAALLVGTGCHHTRIEFPNQTAPGMEPQSETVWGLWWGARQANIHPADCPSGTLSEVTTSTNLGFSFITVISLGCFAPMSVEYRCAKLAPAPGPT
jgi:hypothetical protein